MTLAVPKSKWKKFENLMKDVELKRQLSGRLLLQKMRG
jgi:hypothetical protein